MKNYVLKIMRRIAAPILVGFISHSQLYAQDTQDNKNRREKEPISILQNRYFVKQRRPELGLLAGSVLNEAYTKTYTYGARLGIFFNEWVGIEGHYQKASASDSADRKALNKRKYRELDSDEVVTPDPEVNPINSISDFSVVGAPFYGKLNFLNRYIVYSDLYFLGGFAKVDTAQGAKSAFSMGGGIRFYLLESWSIRLDYRSRLYTEKRSGTDSQKNAMSIDLGISYFFL